MGKKTKKLLERLLRCAEQRDTDHGLLRPCLIDLHPDMVEDVKPALFHRYVDDDRALLRINTFCKPAEQEAMVRDFRERGVYSAQSCSTEIIRKTWALIEYPDGSIGKVEPESVHFLDTEKYGG